MQINFKQCNSGNYQECNSRDIEYIVIHYTSNKGDTANNNAVYFSRQKLNPPASAHYFVDENEIWQSVHDADIAWHCGAKTYKHKSCRNANSLGIEICMNDKDDNIRLKSIENAIKLTKMLMQKYNIGIDNVIRHYDVTGKDCPRPMVENEDLWTSFKQSLLQEENQMQIYKWLKDMPDWSQDTFTRMFKVGVISTDKDGAMTVQESSIQPMIWLDRLTDGQIEKLPDLIRLLPQLTKLLENPELIKLLEKKEG